jgi:hypothetical protein
MEHLDSSKLCFLTGKTFRNLGFSHAHAFPHGASCLVLFRPDGKEEYVYGVSPMIEFELLASKVMRVNDVWVRPPFTEGQGIGKKWVNQGLRRIARQIGCTSMESYSLATETAKGFWNNMPGWNEKSERTYFSEVNS